MSKGVGGVAIKELTKGQSRYKHTIFQTSKKVSKVAFFSYVIHLVWDSGLKVQKFSLFIHYLCSCVEHDKDNGLNCGLNKSVISG